MSDLKTQLKQFTGTTHWYRHPIYRKYTYTDGVKFLTEKAGAYWLVDDILIYQSDPDVRKYQFQAWQLTRNENDQGAVLRVEDGDYNHIKSFDITFTDFPLDKITLWFTNEVLLLPSEY